MTRGAAANVAQYLAGREDWLQTRFAASGRKLDTGKACVHFRRLDDCRWM